MYSVIKFLVIVVQFCWRRGWGILNPNINPMRHSPLYARYFATVLLGCFWSLAFGLYTAQFFYIGINMLAHLAIISAAFSTWVVFQGFKHQYPAPLGRPGRYPLMRHPTAEQRCYEMTDGEKLAAAQRTDQLLSQKQV